MKYQGRRTVFKVTQWKDGCVYKTKPVGEVWIDIDGFVNPDKDTIYASLSTARSLELGYKETMRRVADDTPSVVNIILKNEK